MACHNLAAQDLLPTRRSRMELGFWPIIRSKDDFMTKMVAVLLPVLAVTSTFAQQTSAPQTTAI
jgi:hypothetical protein